MSKLKMIAPGDLTPWPDLNPRRRFPAEWMEQLTASVREEGVLEPLLVHFPEGQADWTTGWIVAGETRWRAASAANLETIPCIVKEFTLEEALKVALIENMQRNDLTAVEEARGFKRLQDDVSLTQEEIAERVKKSQPYVANRIRLLDLPPEIVELIDVGTILPSAARDYLLPFDRLTDKPRQKFFAWVAKEAAHQAEGETLNSRDLREIVGDIGIRMSNSIRRGDGWGDSKVHFSTKEHEKCECGGPAFRYTSWGEPTVRCFDEKWWKEANDRARAREEKRAAAKLAKAQDKAAEISESILTHDQLRDIFGYQEITEIAYAGELSKHGDLYDPSRLPAENLAWVESHNPKVLSLYCTSGKVARSAKAAATRELNKRLAEDRARQLTEDLEAIANKPFDSSHLPGLFGATTSYSFRDDAKEAVHDLGIEGVGEWYDSERFNKVDPGDLRRLAALIAIRSARGDLGHNPPWKQRVKDKLRKEYNALLPEAPEIPAVVSTEEAVPAGAGA